MNTTTVMSRNSQINRDILVRAVNAGSLTPQSESIARHLLANKSITGVEAAAIYKTRSITRRIADIRDLNVDVRSERRNDHTGQRYVRYVLD